MERTVVRVPASSLPQSEPDGPYSQETVVTNWFLENPDEDETTETEQQMRNREIRTRLERAQKLETVEAMKLRYEQYEK